MTYARILSGEEQGPIKVAIQGFPHGPVLRHHAPNAGDPGSIPGWEIIYHMPQQRSKIPRVATNTRSSQNKEIKINIKKKGIPPKKGHTYLSLWS